MNIVGMVTEALQMIPLWLRRTIYVVVVLAFVVQKILTIWYDDPDPEWVRKAGDVLEWLGGFAALMAGANAQDNYQGQHERED